jgi:hypothetical protein
MCAQRLHLHRAAFLAAVLATLPYLVLKLLWLTGSKIGTTDRDGADELSSTGFVAGNSITVLLMVVAAVFVVLLTRSWANRVPARLVFVLAAGATGLLTRSWWGCRSGSPSRPWREVRWGRPRTRVWRPGCSESSTAGSGCWVSRWRSWSSLTYSTDGAR